MQNPNEKGYHQVPSPDQQNRYGESQPTIVTPQEYPQDECQLVHDAWLEFDETAPEEHQPPSDYYDSAGEEGIEPICAEDMQKNVLELETTQRYDEIGCPERAVGKCKFLGDQLDNPFQSEDERTAAISIVLPFGEDGEQMAHALSTSNLGYLYEETQRRIETLRATGESPWPCKAIHDYFSKCPEDCCLESRAGVEPSPVLWCYQDGDRQKPGRTDTLALKEDQNRNPLAIEDLLPDRGFIRDYMRFVSPLTEAPRIYHLFNSLVILSIVLNKKVYIQFGDTRLSPNVWVILIGPSSYSHKSTAISYAVNLIRELDAELILPSDFSTEALIETLHQNPVGLLVSPEFQSILGVMDRSYMVGAKAILTELFDCPDSYSRRLKSGTMVVERPFISWLAGTTPDLLTSSTKNRDLQSGFLARFTYVPMGDKEADNIMPPESDVVQKSKLISQLKDLAAIPGGKIDLSRIVKQHEEFAIGFRKLAISEDNETFTSFIYRLEITTLKIATLVELSRTGQLSISPESHMVAVRIVRHLADLLKREVMGNLMATDDSRAMIRIENYIKKNPGCSSGAILRDCNVYAEKARNLIDVLETSSKIYIERKGKGRYHYPVGSSPQAQR